MNSDDGFQINSVDEMATFVHEVYLSFVRSGFTENQAFNLASQYFIATARSGVEDKGND